MIVCLENLFVLNNWITLDFVLKPKHSAFYCTPLDILLNHLGTKNLIITGFAGNICVLFTANDAYMRNFKLIVPNDCIGSNTSEVNKTKIYLFYKNFVIYFIRKMMLVWKKWEKYLKRIHDHQVK
jgi:nicotinamidase-related amidase